MNKAKVIGLTVTVLAVVGGVAVYNYLRKPRRNSDGFFNADGTKGSHFYTRRVKCLRPNGSYYVTREGQDYCTYSSDKIIQIIEKEKNSISSK